MKSLTKILTFAAMAAMLCNCDDTTSASSSQDNEVAIVDTVTVYDTLTTVDTLIVSDTIVERDTIVKVDTLTKKDTVTVTKKDTVTVTKTDSVFVPEVENLQYLSAIKALSWSGNTVYTIGHLNPDADAVFSAIAYAALMDSLGYKVEPRMTAEARVLTQYLADHWDIKLPEVLNDASSKEIILVDHSEYAQAVKGADKARIMQIIDHHNLGSAKESNLIFSKIMPVGSTCTIVYTTFKEVGVAIDEKMAKILLAGIVTDTKNLTKQTTTQMDKDAQAALLEIAGLTEQIEDIYAGIEEVDRNHDGMTPYDIFAFDVKEYDATQCANEITYAVGSIDWYEDPALSKEENTDAFIEFADSILDAMKTYPGNKALTYKFSKLDKHIVDPSAEDGFSKEGTHILYYGEGSEDIATEAFKTSEAMTKLLNSLDETDDGIDNGDIHEFEIIYRMEGEEGGLIRTNSDMNRKKVVYPRLDDAITAKPCPVSMAP
ncbi:DHH family phosphoesterase [Fibrobacter sp.]|uniref:DHH family phosphoesterase n=1 Tax=Fibrobacter sp. TaxID=35828 RepID=UPI00388FFC56